jgi:N-acetylmuramoyl-L-alanine amidase
MRRVLLDYGHGGLVDGAYPTPGKRYTFTGGPVEWTVLEGVLNRRVAARLASLLVAGGVDVHDVVAGRRIQRAVGPGELEQRDTTLGTRTANANAAHRAYGDSVLVSIHANAVGSASRGPSQPARGFSVFTSPGRTGADELAERILVAAKGLGVRVREDRSDGDGDYERDLHITRESIMPAVLVESGFFTNADEARWLTSEEGVETIAQAVARGLGVAG